MEEKVEPAPEPIPTSAGFDLPQPVHRFLDAWLASLAAQRRASLAAVGLERRARPVTVEGVVAELVEAKAAQDGAGAANGSRSDAEAEHAREGATEGT